MKLQMIQMKKIQNKEYEKNVEEVKENNSDKNKNKDEGKSKDDTEEKDDDRDCFKNNDFRDYDSKEFFFEEDRTDEEMDE
eukprot:9116342-Ditylum_brightwellii.AAC.1